MHPTQLAKKLAELGEQLPSCLEKAVIFQMAASLYAGLDNREVADLSAQIARKMIERKHLN